MRLARPGRRSLLAALALAVLAIVPATAGAAVTSSQITTPANPVFKAYDANSSDPQTFAIAGTSDGTTGDSVDVRCYSTLLGQRQSVKVAAGVAVGADGSFSAEGAYADFSDTPFGVQSCVLRAVPATGEPAFVSPFAGPSMHIGRIAAESKNGEVVYGYAVAQTQPKGRWSHGSPMLFGGNCHGSSGQPYSGGDAYASGFGLPWLCAGVLSPFDGIDSSGIVIDGQAGYDPSEQQNRNSGATTGRTGYMWTSSLDPATGNLIVTDRSAIQRCADAQCSAFESTGVTLERKIVQDRQGQMATITDSWTSTDGAAHDIQLSYSNTSFTLWFPDGEFLTGAKASELKSSPLGARMASAAALATPSPFGKPIEYKLPGETEYSQPDVYGAVEGLAAAPATINVRVKDLDNSWSYGGLTYTTAPDGLIWSQPSDWFLYFDEFAARYTRSIPAGGEFALTQIYTVGESEAQIGVLGTAAEDKSAGPSVSITTPATGSTVGAAAQTVTGTATDNVGVRSLTLNGKGVQVGARGAYSTPLTLQPGQNTITAIATDAEGNTAQAQSVVTYVPAKTARTCKVPNLRKKRLTAARKAIRKAGCVTGRVRSKATNRVKPGRVMTQGRKAGVRVAVGTRVSLTVARPKPVRRPVIPQFTG